MTIAMNTGKNEKKWHRIGTWNIRSINGKEKELIQEVKKYSMEILAITETKKKGEGETTIEEYGLLYSGVEMNKTAQAGVGCVISPQYMKKLLEWKAVSKRTMKVTFTQGHDEKMDVIIVYGPGENDPKEEKEQFWSELQMVYDEADNTTIIMGDFNGRIGNDNVGRQGVMGIYGEETRNTNGERLIDFCIQNGLVIQNSFFQHKDCHKYTREEPGRNEKSIIDYIITEKIDRRMIQDVRVYRGAEISSDHYLLGARLKINETIEKERVVRDYYKKEIKTIKIHKLQDPKIRQDYEEQIKKGIQEVTNNLQEMSIEEKWEKFKEIIYKAGRKACGISIAGGSKKRTSWWNEEIKNIIKTKKNRWRAYLQQRDEESYEKYKIARKTAKEKIKIAKAKEWEEFGTKMEKDSRTNQKLFYRVLKNMKNKGKKLGLRQIMDKEGKMITEDNKIMDRWKQYYQDILEGEEINEEETEIGGENAANSVEGNGNTQNEEERDSIQLEEVKKAIRKLKNGKAAGVDGLKAELLKYMGEDGMKLLHRIISEVWETLKVPKDWQTSVIIPIFKKGNQRECSNYRGISLLCTASKVYEMILEGRLRKGVEEKLHGAQSGFRPGHCTHDHIFTIRNVIEKSLPYNKEVYICFVDLEKAFDKVSRQKLWEVLERNSIPNSLINAIKSLYRKTENIVRKDNQETGKFRTTKGVRQGGNLSPLLFIILMDEIIRNVSSKRKKMVVGHHKLKPVEVGDCVFADDVAVMANTERSLQFNVNLWMEELENKEMKVNISKTKVMVITNNKERRASININNQTVEQVDNIKYLGITIDRTGKMEEEINNRIATTTKLFHGINRGFLNKKEISSKTKLTIYKTVYLPTLLYGSETWVMTEKLHKKIQVLEMKYLRKVAKVTIMDKIRNEEIRERLEIENVKKHIEKAQLRWWGHMKRLPEERQVRQVWEARTTGRRKKGRPSRTWDKEVDEIMNRRGLNWNQAEIMARDRTIWRAVVKERR